MTDHSPSPSPTDPVAALARVIEPHWWLPAATAPEEPSPASLAIAELVLSSQWYADQSAAAQARGLLDAAETLDRMQTPDNAALETVRRDPALWLTERADALCAATDGVRDGVLELLTRLKRAEAALARVRELDLHELAAYVQADAADADLGTICSNLQRWVREAADPAYQPRTRRATASDGTAEIAAELHREVAAALAKLDGTTAAAVSLITGLSRAELDDLGGLEPAAGTV